MTAREVPYARGEGRDDAEISLLEILVLLARQKRLVFGFPLACALIAALISLLMPNIYTGTARVLPPQQGGSPIAAALLDSAGGGGGAGAFIGQALGLKNPADLYVGMLQSWGVADALIQRFELQKRYDKGTLVQTREKLADVSKIVAGRDGIILVEVDDPDPAVAAKLANAYVDELDRLTQNLAVTSAGRQRVFFEKQLKEAKDRLADAEVALRKTQERTGLISVSEQGKAMIESVAGLRALVAAKQVQLGAMRTAVTEANPEYVRTQQELAGLRIELAKLEKNNPTDASTVIPSAGKIPENGLEYVRRYRDVQYYQTLFELLAKQFEIAKFQEAAEAGVIQVLDRAGIPDRKSKPARAVIVLITFLLTGMLGVIAALMRAARDKAKEDPAALKLINELEGHFALGRSAGRSTDVAAR